MKKAHTRSNLIGFCRGLMRLHHRNTSIFFVLLLFTLIFIATILALYFIQASYVLGVQITVSKYRSNCETVHIATVVGGRENTLQFVTLAKSILAKSQNPLHFHLITDEQSHLSLKVFFSTWELPGVTASFYNGSSFMSRVNWIPNIHYSGNYGLMKLLIPEILPAYLEKVIVLDTDLLFLTDVIELWSHFSFMASHEFLGMTDNLSGWYTQNISGPKWPAIRNGFNSGVILMHLANIRNIQFAGIWRAVATDYLKITGRTILADQDIFNAVLLSKPEMLYLLPSEYNVQVGMKSRVNDKLLQNARVIHVNNKNKSLTSYLHLESFRKSIEDLDSSVFSTTRFICTPVKTLMIRKDNEDECEAFRPLQVYRTQLFLLPFKSPNKEEVTVISQLSTDRLSMLDSLLSSWNGPVSIALYGTDSEIKDLSHFIGEKYKNRHNIGLHGVYAKGNLYPINYLRNVALDYSETDFVFLIDGDFVIYNESAIVQETLLLSKRSVLVIPAFEIIKSDYETSDKSISKSSLTKMILTNNVKPFRVNIWPTGHKATKFDKWMNATFPYEIEWEPDFEPYFIGNKLDIPRFDQRFGGFGWNKATYAFEMKTKRIRFLVHPTSFVIHRHHPPSNELVKYRSNPLYRKCLLRFKRDFVNDLLSSNHAKSTE